MTLKLLGFVLAWAVVAIPVSMLLFLHTSKDTTIASHDAKVNATFDGYATLDLGPYLPDLRYPTGTTVGAFIDLGKTNANSYHELIERYAFIGSQPRGQIARLRATLTDLAYESALRGALVGLVLPGLWLLLGERRRQELATQVTVPRTGAVLATGAIVSVLALEPWTARDSSFDQEIQWQSIAEALPEVPIPEPAQKLQIDSGLMTRGTERLAQSAVDTYTKSVRFYHELANTARGLSDRLHQPADDETVAILVSDRHDNIGMDPVARVIAEEGRATILLDAGDDTSTGEPWEAFSLDSLDKAFEDIGHRYSVAGNHDNGPFVTRYLSELGFETLNGEVVEGPDGIRLLGANDPRASGLGSWRDEPGEISFDEQKVLIAEAACDSERAGERISTLLVHDANSGELALERGCVDLVVGGHIHAQLGPTVVVGDNGEVGYSYTNGTTGGAAYALAIGSKLRRNAEVTLITYRDGRPVGLQPIIVRTVGDFLVGEYRELDLTPDTAGETPNGPTAETSPSGAVRAGGGGGI